MPLFFDPETSVLLLNCVTTLLIPLTSNNTCIFVMDFESKLPMPIIYHDSDREPEKYPLVKVDLYLLDSRRNGLKKILSFLEKRTLFNPRAVFVIVVEKFVDYFDVIRGFFIEKTIILDYVSEDQIVVHNFKALENDGLAFNFPLSLSVCTENGTTHLRSDPNHDRKEKLEVIKVGAGGNVPSIISTEGLPSSGVDMDILLIISKKLGFKTEISVVDVFAGTKNARDFTFNGSLGFLERREVDLVIGGVLPTSEGSMSFDFTRATSANRYAWIVPAAKVRPFWKRLIFTFNHQVWMIFSATFIVNLVLLSLVNRFIMKGVYQWDKELLKLYSMCISPVSIKCSEMPSKKILYTSWYLFLLIFTNYFTAKLLSNLVVKKFEYQIHKLHELMDVDWKICIFSDLITDIGYYEEEKLMSCTNCATCTNRTAYEGDVVSIRSEKLTLFEMSKFYTNKDREPLVFILKQFYLATYDVMVFRKNHPLFKKFNKVLGYLIESGVYDRIERKYESTEIDGYPRTSWMSLKRKQLQFTFQFLSYGLILSFFVFVIELLMFKRN